MIVDADLLRRARGHDRAAVIEVLAAQYPATHRIAHGLSGRADVGDGIVVFVMKQSLRVLPKWTDEEAPQRWFRHHTLLTVRRAARWKPDATSDTLLAQSADQPADGQYAAFVRALRALPQQQVEAFLLTHGERLDLRSLAVAMDCSTTAAAIHLREAEDRLRQLSGESFHRLLAQLQQAYERLAPGRDLILWRVGSSVQRQFWARLAARLLRLVIFGALLGAVAWLAWRFGGQIIEWLRGVLTRLGRA